MPKSYDWCVVGGGTAGLYAAYHLAGKGQSVVLVEAAETLGGVLSGRNWNGFHVDNGCHLLDFGNDQSAEFYGAILADGIIPVDLRYGSINRGRRSDGLAVPDFSLFPDDDRARALDELGAVIEQGAPGSATTLREALNERFGPFTGEELAGSVGKLCGGDPDQLSSEALEILSYLKRIRIDEDSRVEQLKQRGPEWDDRLAISTQSDPMRFQETRSRYSHRDYYPASGAMAGFCDAAGRALTSRGVEVTTGFRVEKIETGTGRAVVTGSGALQARRVYWSLPQVFLPGILGFDVGDLRRCFHPVSAWFWAFRAAKGAIAPYTYIHDYTPDGLIFRSSSAGLYSRQSNNRGESFVIAEAYESMIAPRIGDTAVLSDDVWGELKSMGQVAADATYSDVDIWGLKTALMLPKPDWPDRRPILEEALADYDDIVVRPPLNPRGKRAIFPRVIADLTPHL